VLGEKFLADGFRQLTEDFLNMYFLITVRSTSDYEYCQSTLRRVFGGISEPVVGTADPSELSIPRTPEELQAQLKTAWEKGERSSKDNLETYVSKQDFQTWDVPLGSIEDRRQVLEERQLRLSKRTGAAQQGGIPAKGTSSGQTQEQPKSRSDCHVSSKDFGASKSDSELLKRLFSHPNLRSPGILLTTGDRIAGLLAQRCLAYLEDTIKACVKAANVDVKTAQEALGHLVQIIEEQLIVRRFDIDNITGATLFDVVQRNLVEAQYLIHGAYFPPNQSIRYERADRIRVVIDDMRVLSNLCPSVSGDSAFLPFLVFYLEREGVTTLIVHTGEVRPGTRPDDPISQELMSLLKQLILTWSVPFEGQSRIAISALPAASKETNGIVREVEVGQLLPRSDHPLLGFSAELPKVDVTRHLELYADLESGKPRLVPLAVYLFAATDACRRYIDQEDLLFRAQFRPVPGREHPGCSNRVLWPIDATEYFAIRDVTHLPWDVKADHTIVDQVDGFWSLDSDSGALASQREYLLGIERTLHDDPFGLFTGRPLIPRGRLGKGPYPRKQYFQNSNYRSRIVVFEDEKPEGMPDRIPFMWDFGFILASADPWDRAAPREIRFLHTVPEGEVSPYWTKFHNVSRVLDELSKPWEQREVVGWRPFMGACQAVADVARAERGINPVAFDFAATSAETLLSLFLEIWFSEIELAVSGDKDFVGGGFFNTWEKLRRRLTSKKYQPLNPGSPDVHWYSLARLLRVPPVAPNPNASVSEPSAQPTERRGRSIEEYFGNFRQRYIENLLEYCEGIEGTEPAREGEPDSARLERAGPKGKEIIRWREELRKLSAERGTPDRNNVDIDLIMQTVDEYEADRKQHAECRKLFQELPVAALCLYKAWLLLQDVFDFSAVLDPSSVFETKQPKEPSEFAMAVRHYYRTACHEQMRQTENGPDEPHYLLAMPGSFSTRGDSFLASAKASRSQLMASNAIDLLCSRRANLTRMQMGIGLPVRDVMEPEQCKEMRTALRAINAGGALGDVKYDRLSNLGGTPPDETENPKKLEWLFRNGLPDYDRISRTMQKWLTRLFRWTISYRARHVLGWDGGFHGYDALSVHTFGAFFTYTSFDEFGKLCDYLIAELEAAERQFDGGEPDGR
jgi:hypothetical protein